ncbi:MAG: CheR family methyltransferase [Bacteriovorax sp.]
MQEPAERNELDEIALEKFLELVHLHTGITMTHAKKILLQGRIGPRIKKLGLPSYASYIERLISDKAETQEFINLVTTHETSFFRTQRVWDFFNKEYLPEWSKNNPDKTLRIWSGACSSGEEVYTIGICCEEFRRKNSRFDYQILGTDISTSVVSIAEMGEYAGRSIESFKNGDAILFEKYLEKKGDRYRVSNELRSKIRFSTHNLYHAPTKVHSIDIAFLRNVLIYFSKEDQESVLFNIGKALIDRGVLVIGESESLNSINT